MKKPLILFCLLALVSSYAQGCREGFRLFDHDLLITEPLCIPENPERVAAIDRFSFETMLALEIKPVAASSFARTITRDLAYLEEDVTEVVDIGQEPNLEALLGLKPDLILTSVGYGEYAQLSEIAPTIQTDFESSAQWQQLARAFGDAAGLATETEALLAGYKARLAALREAVGDPGAVEVSVVRASPDYISLYSQDRSSFLGVILEDADFAVPQAQAEAVANNPAFDGTITLEQLPLVNADVLFIWSFATSAEAAADARGALDTLRENPLWRALPVIQANEMYMVGGYWIGSSFHAAHAVLDDLFTYVADVNPAEVAPNPLRPSGEASE